MKKNLFVIGLLAVTLSLIFTGCPPDGNTNPGGNTNPDEDTDLEGGTGLEGTWQMSITGGDSDEYWVRYEFSGSTFFESMKEDGDTDWTLRGKGTFESTSTTVTMTLTHAWDETSWVAIPADEQVTQTSNYTISGNTLTLTQSIGSISASISFTKV